MFLWLRPLHLNLSKAAFVICHIWTVSRLKHCSQLSSFPLKELFLIKDIWHRKRGTHFSSFNRLKFFFSWYVNSVLISTEDSTVHGVYINGKNCDWQVAGCLIRWNRGIRWNIIGELPEELPWLHLDYYNSFWCTLRVSKPLSNECRDTIRLIYHGISPVGL